MIADEFPVGGASSPLELAGKASRMVALVVKARFGYEFIEAGERWSVAKGDTGVLCWKSHQRHPRYLEPLVVWDNDPSHKARKSILSSLAVIGLQSENTRVLVIFRFA